MRDEIVINGKKVRILSQTGNYRMCLLVDESREFHVPISILQRYFKKPLLNQSIIQEFIDGKGASYLTTQKEINFTKIYLHGKR